MKGLFHGDSKIKGAFIHGELWAALWYYKFSPFKREKLHALALTENIVNCIMKSCEC